MELDYIIVGCGLAGISFCETLLAENKPFVVFDNQSQKASTVAGGLYNPVVLKRFTSVWKSKEQLDLALPMYSRIEKRLNIKLDYKVSVYRRFTSLEEQNNWFAASDKAELEPYLSLSIQENTNKSIDAPFGFGEVLQTGRVDTKLLIESYKSFLRTKNQLIETDFEYDKLKTNNEITYNSIKAKHIVFAEGFGVKQNPFFKDVPLKEVKGELITIHAPDLKLEKILKSSVFIIPLGNDLYRVGSTYNWKDKTHETTEEAKEELITKLKSFITCSFKVVKQVAGIRPTVTDRRPIAGVHSDYKDIYVLNGLGTRGVMIGPYLAKELFNYIENKIPLDKEIDWSRFQKD
jgi:glycine/D-amino acid oxidase-like deaminating enzyme